MNRIKEVAKREGRTLTWLAAQLGMERGKFETYIGRSSFKPEEKLRLSMLLNEPEDRLFPSAVKVEVQA